MKFSIIGNRGYPTILCLKSEYIPPISLNVLMTKDYSKVPSDSKSTFHQFSLFWRVLEDKILQQMHVYLQESQNSFSFQNFTIRKFLRHSLQNC